MLQRPTNIALLRAVLAENCASDEAAEQHLLEARRLAVEPLDYCAHRLGLGHSLVYERAAAWAGFAFSAVIPTGASVDQGPADLDRLTEVQTLKANILGRELVFWSPRFETLIRLKARRRDEPTLSTRICIVPPDTLELALTERHSATMMDEARQRLARSWSGQTAAAGLSRAMRVRFVFILVAMIVLAMAAGAISRPILVPLVAILLLAPASLRMLALLPRGERRHIRPLADWELPTYSVLIPLRDEVQMVPMLRRAMGALDYPPEKLDIRFVVESTSQATIAAVRSLLGDPRFRLVVVPKGPPHTKPKAVNYALPLARGEFFVVYDAEDVPERDQLRRAASHFAADPQLACLQAELVPENASENALTALFAGEYAGLFGRLLPALARWNLPVPLGGTSNHFRLSVLREIGGWDAHNVTEDADLGVRLRRRLFKVEPFASRTFEEAPTNLHAWMAQRTRWMKGWMVTYLVHMLAPRQLLRELGWRAFIGFHVLVGGMIVTALLHTVFIGGLLGRLVFEGLTGFAAHDIWDVLSIGVLVAGYGAAFAVVAGGLAHLKAWHLLPVQLLLPFYWLLHSIAAFYAARDLITRPHFWAEHGVTRLSRDPASTTESKTAARKRSPQEP